MAVEKPYLDGRITLNDKLKMGRYKTWVNRLQTYMGPLNFVMILYLYIQQEPLGIIWQVWFILLGAALVGLLLFDLVIVYPSELKYSTRKNPEWNDLRDDIRTIKEKLGVK